MKKILSLVLLGVALPFCVTAQSFDPYSVHNPSLIQKLKAQFFSDQQAKFDTQKQSILERLKKYRLFHSQSTMPTNESINKLPALPPAQTDTSILPLPAISPDKRFVSNECQIISLCNGPIECVSKYLAVDNMAGTCMYKPEMDCYKQDFNRCEVQQSGDCGWSQTKELLQCIAEKKQATFRSEGEPHSVSQTPPAPVNNQGNIDLTQLREHYPGSRMTYFIDKPFLGDTRKAPGAEEKAADAENTFWTQWMNRDRPSGTGDWEQYSDFQKLYPGVCKDSYPLDTECQTADGRPYTVHGQVIQRCSYGGFICENVAQQGSMCQDYRVRFLCGGTPPEEEKNDPRTSQWQFNTQINDTPPEKPEYIPTKYPDTLTKDSETTTYQYGCTENSIDGICDRYQLKTSYGETDPYQLKRINDDPQSLLPTDSEVPATTDVLETQSWQRVQQRFNEEDRYERLKRAQEILKSLRNR